jgi:hypothetical protein
MTAAGDGIIAVCSAVGLAVSIFNYFQPDGIGGSAGALLVIASSALILAASLVRRLLASPGWRITLGALLFLGILGTGFAAYMLEAWLLLGLMALAMIGWLISVFAGGPLAARPGLNPGAAR